MTDPSTEPRSWVGKMVTGLDTHPLGRLVAVYDDNATRLPTWAAVEDGSGHTALVPLAGARYDGSAVHIPYGVEQVRTAPHRDPARHLTYEDGAAVHRHYVTSSPQRPADPSGGATVTRWEEQLRVGTETVVTGRVRVRKYAVTEEQTFTVPVTREEISIEHEDVPPGERTAQSGAGLGEEVYEIVRYEERVMFTKELVPVERVRVVKHVVTTAEVVGGEVRREIVDTIADPPASIT